MSTANLGWLFYRDYFNGIIYDDFLKVNEKIEDFEKRMEQKYSKELQALGKKPSDKQKKKEWEIKRHCIIFKNDCLVNKKVDRLIDTKVLIPKEEPLGNIHFKATTTYPGLLLGSGYLHELPSINGQAILGFDFDYTTGLPIIRGSSIKGVLRSAFKKEEYIKEILEKEIDVKKLEVEIFGQDNGNNEAIKGKDIFFDAVLISQGVKLLEDDYLAPHGNDPLKNPTPIRFIKVASGNTFRFNFWLNDGSISKDEKALLFAQILYDLGLGAKTNVGYGKFDEKLTKDRVKRQLQEKKEELKKQEEERKKALKEKEMKEKLKQLTPVDAIKLQIKDLTDNKDIYDLLIDSSLKDGDKQNIESFVLSKIGPKPSKPKPAKRKWAIKIYEFFGK